MSPRPSAGDTPRVLQRRGGHVVTLEQHGTVVAKSFGPGPEQARLAAAELRRLQQLHAALAPVEGVTCPQPLGLRHEPNPVLTTAFVVGVPMTEHLAAHRADRAFRSWLAEHLVRAAEVYAEACGEPVPDLHFRNMLYEPTGGDVAVLDLGDPDRARTVELDGSLAPAAVGVVRLVGSTLFECSRPRHLLRLRTNVGTARAAGATLEAAAAAGHGDVDRLGAAALAIHDDLAGGRGALRRLWYSTAGAALARTYRRVLLPRRRRGG